MCSYCGKLYDTYQILLLTEQYVNGINNTVWQKWHGSSKVYRDREPQALEKARKRFDKDIKQYCFEQFVFYSQWQELKNYAHENGVHLFGDMPFFVALDSADVWANRKNFLLHPNGKPEFVSGIPGNFFGRPNQQEQC